MADDPALHVILLEPEIAANTGAIGRTCVAVGARLWLVRPLGFRLDDRRRRRAGLDYWESLDLRVVDDLDAAAAAIPGRLWSFTTRARRLYSDAAFSAGDALVFGPESRGLPDRWLASQPDERLLRIPMRPEARSLNLANAAAVAVYEAVRQLGFDPGPADPGA
jgi:tRNA (cytidine/uridine-2'-O-)-methyltransferase